MMNSGFDMEEGIQMFSEESRELLELSEATLLKLEEKPDDQELIDELFRSVHTIKGSSGIFGYDDVVAFTHIVESVMGQVRDGSIALNYDLISLLLDSCDHISTLVDRAISNSNLTEGEKNTDKDLLVRLHCYLGSDGAISSDAAEGSVSLDHDNQEADESARESLQVESDNWHISLRFGREVFKNGMDPLSFFRYLPTVGDIVNMTVVEDEIPPLNEFDPEECYLGFEIDLKSEADKNTIAEVFEFVQDDCVIHILPPRTRITDYIRLIEELPEEDYLIGELLVKSGALSQHELQQALNKQRALKETMGADPEEHNGGSPVSLPLGEVVVAEGMSTSRVVKAALDKQIEVKNTKELQQQSIRVNANKLSELINLVGELVISSAHAELRAKRAGDEALYESIEAMTCLVEDIRDATLGLRMVQIGDTFDRFKRVIRDLSSKTGKQIDLTISGSETELDKTVVEKIADPLMHLVRNAVDHGVELPEIREAANKPPGATISLEAFHESGTIIIEITDDGAGLNKEKILEKALQNNLISANQSLSDQDIYRLIFEPGFSTAEEVTDISGRGVGMDVVRRNIDALRGQIDVESEADKGTKFIIRLPLTLAIIDGFQVQVGKSYYVVPLDMVDECIELDGDLYACSDGGDYLNLRGEVLPFVRLGDLFKETQDNDRRNLRDNIVVVQFAGQKAGLVVDELLGEYQTVIKPLGPVFKHINGISGATILGSGDVAMIVDVPSLVQIAQSVSNEKMNPLHAVGGQPVTSAVH